MVDAKKLIKTWRDDLGERDYFGTPKVQDRLLGLWGEVGEAGTKVVEHWLSITPHRDLFSAEELRQMLDEVEALVDSTPLPA
ncbi:MAG: hypothetical protein H0W70_04035 [Actinobacteria bacterium]|nr:hypothetical protein [Actinomycetota bacterium]